ncbi:monooxygenase [Marinobacter flavimaris]|jgi:styrene monooxygenase|uniref:Monooxygenase n=1 Tax=Marinobacter flavimaris TaxID=262076 RepID=A0A3D8GXU1_9GAMM|nr:MULTISPECIES: styrene monooxygenase/indole monooxygenase family protein [Marinobacter]MBO6812081.1 monooxygenase [Marinobacter sp.]MBO6873671.1 monooxygenase [Marinobacter sp.]PPI78647.1 monooxygenase [Marinobacter flavimaris]RDU39270.1 monooxygenase [Marinobacter flavimaris]ROQ42659.1 styrene monooxygenase [Marinobacter sp. 3-2]|tara:strand:- start:8316 stop:9563 length:1248 start_codon:yes stop_codon:yes gene_type:complete
MNKRICIVGAGAAGLHLGLYLQQHNVDVTLYSDRRPEDYRTARLLNTVAHHSVTIAREADLNVNKWPVNENGYYGHYYYVGTPTPLRFYGDLATPSRAVDYRLYLPELMTSFAERGGLIVHEQISADDLETLSEQYDLLVVCTGKGGFGSLFEARESATPFKTPQRALCVGLFKGIKEAPIRSVTMSFSPGAGEMIEIPTLSFDGMCTALVLENHFGGDLEILSKTKYDNDPRAFLDLLLEKLYKHHPSVAERIDPEKFDLAHDANDILQGAVPPIFREGSAQLSNGKTVIGLGDVMATVDPLLGQGANMASHAARVLGEEIVATNVFDERFVEHLESRREDRVLCATRWTNYMLKNLKELPPEFQQFIGTLSQSREMADEFTNNFNYPEKQWDYFSSPDRLAEWCKRFAGPQAA